MFVSIFFGDFILALSGNAQIYFFSKQSIVYTLVAFLCAILLSFSCFPLKIFTIFCICLPQICNIGYIAYSGVPIGCDEIFKVFTEFSDIGKNVCTVFWIIPSLIIPLGVFAVFTIKYRKKFYRFFVCDVFLILFLAKLFNMAYVEDFLYAVPVPSRTTIINTMRTLPYCLIHLNDKPNITYPSEVINGIQTKLVNKNSPRVVIVIWGESTNADYLSFLGKTNFTKELDTTPILSKMFANDQKHFITMKAISGATATRASTTLFFNLINTPTDFEKVAKSKKQNLFRLAKQNGYKTYWLSNFETNITEGGGFAVDVLISKDTHLQLSDSKRDDYLLEKIKELDVSAGRHFIGIQFNSLHVHYANNYANHPEFEILKIDSKENRALRTRKEYINNIAYLDYLISEVIKWGKKNNVDIIIYTSDHGEMIASDGEYGEGILYGHNYHGMGDARVPFMLYQKEPNKRLITSLRDKKILFHNEIAQLVANMLGYEINDKNAVKDEFFFYSNRLYGNSVFVKKFKRLNNGKLKQHFYGDLKKFFEKYYNQL